LQIFARIDNQCKRVREENIRIIFGLKIRQLRQAERFSLAALAKETGMSASYLNEIEKGKKYPKTEKIVLLSKVLKVPYDELVSLKLSSYLAPLNDLLTSKLITDLPLNIFGFDLGKMIESVYDSPAKVGAFISTIVEIAREYDNHKGDFYFKALRSYQEINENYFEELEKGVDTFIKQYGFPTDSPVEYEMIVNILRDKFSYQVENIALEEFPELASSRYVFIPNTKKNQLLLNPNLSPTQKLFIVGRELAFNMLEIKDRPHYSMLLEVDSFDHMLNSFRASYCAMAFAINRKILINDLEILFSKQTWDADLFIETFKRYKVSPELLFSRILGLLPRFFGIKDTFFIRLQNHPKQDKILLTKQIQLGNTKDSHIKNVYEHHCRRWVSIKLLDKLKQQQAKGKEPTMVADIQRSQYMDSDGEFLCIAIARPMAPTPDLNAVTVLGVRLNSTARKKIRFWNDAQIPRVEVNNVCERCTWTECPDRSVPPTQILAKEKSDKIKEALGKLKRSRS